MTQRRYSHLASGYHRVERLGVERAHPESLAGPRGQDVAKLYVLGGQQLHDAMVTFGLAAVEMQVRIHRMPAISWHIDDSLQDHIVIYCPACGNFHFSDGDVITVSL